MTDLPPPPSNNCRLHREANECCDTWICLSDNPPMIPAPPPGKKWAAGERTIWISRHVLSCFSGFSAKPIGSQIPLRYCTSIPRKPKRRHKIAVSYFEWNSVGYPNPRSNMKIRALHAKNPSLSRTLQGIRLCAREVTFTLMPPLKSADPWMINTLMLRGWDWESFSSISRVLLYHRYSTERADKIGEILVRKLRKRGIKVLSSPKVLGKSPLLPMGFEACVLLDHLSAHFAVGGRWASSFIIILAR